MATGSALMRPLEGQRLSARCAHWGNRHVFALSMHDPGLWARFIRVFNKTAPPSLPFGPRVLARVL
ncbi:hypothetical protein [Streptomyces sp. DSM 118878]